MFVCHLCQVYVNYACNPLPGISNHEGVLMGKCGRTCIYAWIRFQLFCNRPSNGRPPRSGRATQQQPRYCCKQLVLFSLLPLACSSQCAPPALPNASGCIKVRTKKSWQSARMVSTPANSASSLLSMPTFSWLSVVAGWLGLQDLLGCSSGFSERVNLLYTTKVSNVSKENV